MKRKIKQYCTILLAVFLAAQSIIGGITGAAIRVKADIVYDLNWEMEKKGVYQNIPNLVKTSFGKPGDWIKSGIYSYEFLDDDKKYITVRHVDNVGETLVIPAEIDGYKVIGIGCWGLSAGRIKDDGGWQGEMSCISWHEGAICTESDKLLRKIILPEGLEFIGTGAFICKRGDSNLNSINFPKSLVYIGSYAFLNQALKSISIPSGTYVDVQAFRTPEDNWERVECYSDCKIQGDNFIGNKDTVIIKKKGDAVCSVPESVINRTKHLYLSGALKKVYFQLEDEEVWDGHDSMLPVTAFTEELYVNNKKTVLSVEKAISVGSVYTVEGASAIQYAKKTKTTYHIKSTGKAKEVKAKKKDGAYLASWKKIKTTVKKYEYKENKAKWKATTSPAQTLYKVYGKKTKNGSYQLIKTTKKKSIKSEYKYIKAVADKKWD